MLSLCAGGSSIALAMTATAAPVRPGEERPRTHVVGAHCSPVVLVAANASLEADSHRERALLHLFRRLLCQLCQGSAPASVSTQGGGVKTGS